MLFSYFLFFIGCASLINCAALSFSQGDSAKFLDTRNQYNRFRNTSTQNGRVKNTNNNGANNEVKNGANNGAQNETPNQIILAANALQTASAKTGQEEGTDGIKPGQAPSATNDGNFINFCSGQTLTNGKQITDGSCNGIPMGKIPSTSNMISAMITNPQIGDKVPAGTTFNISVQTSNLAAGFFVNPTTNYYTAPQDLDENGHIIGHCHVTVQEIGSLKSTTPPDPTTFAFFKGIDDAGDGRGLLQAVVTDGLPVGVYRVCTMIAARNHQPVNMPVAQRGAQDDCTKFEVVDASGGNNSGNRGNRKNGGASKNAGNANVGKMESGKVDGQAKDQ